MLEGFVRLEQVTKGRKKGAVIFPSLQNPQRRDPASYRGARRNAARKNRRVRRHEERGIRV